MYTSDTEMNRKRASKTAFVYLLISLFCVLFGAVYEVYSHEVYSYFMIYAFVFPLVGGNLVFNLYLVREIKTYPNAISCNLYHSGIAAITVGSLVQGVLDIYGTTNALINAYWWIGGVLLSGGVTVYIAQLIKKRKIQS